MELWRLDLPYRVNFIANDAFEHCHKISDPKKRELSQLGYRGHFR